MASLHRSRAGSQVVWIVALSAWTCAPDAGTQPIVLPPVCVDSAAAPAPPTALRTFYIDGGSGNDAADGLTPATAWRTLDKANAAAQPGDLFLLNGTFNGQVIHPTVSGTGTAKIVYRVRPGFSALLDVGRFDTIVWLDGLSHVVVDGLELRNVGYAIQLTDGAHDNWMRNLHVHDIGSAFHLLTSSDNRLEDSNIERCGSEAANAGDCIWIANGSDRNIIARNTISFGGHGLIDVGGDQVGQAASRNNVIALNDLHNPWAGILGLIGSARHTLIECNRMRSASTSGVNYARAGLQISADSNVVRFNEIFDNTADGIQLQGYDFGGLLQNSRGNQIYHNTVWGNGGAGIQMFQGQGGQVANNIIDNNIIWGNNTSGDSVVARAVDGVAYDIFVDLYHATSGWAAGSVNGNLIRNNIAARNTADIGAGWLYVIQPAGTVATYTLAQAQGGLGGVVANLQSDPLFVSLGTRDFRLQIGSAAIDAGRVITGVTYLGLAPDLGVHELR